MRRKHAKKRKREVGEVYAKFIFKKINEKRKDIGKEC